MLGDTDRYPILHNFFNTNDAHNVAQQLLALQGVSRIELFGKVARDGVGDDLKMLIVVQDENMYRAFALTLLNLIEGNVGDNRRDCILNRASAVQKIFCGALDFVEERMIQAIREADQNPYSFLDLYIVPLNWRDRLDELQETLSCTEEGFMHRVAKEAWSIAKDPYWRVSYTQKGETSSRNTTLFLTKTEEDAWSSETRQ